MVDDELDITLTIKMVLEKSGFLQVEAFYDPVLALLRFKAGAYDLAILDIAMPEMNGFQLFRKLREIDNKLKICFLTAAEEITTEKPIQILSMSWGKIIL